MTNNRVGQLPFYPDSPARSLPAGFFIVPPLRFDRHARVRERVCVWVLFFSVALFLSLLFLPLSPGWRGRESVGVRVIFLECAPFGPPPLFFFFLRGGRASLKHSFTFDLVGHGQDLDLLVVVLQAHQHSLFWMSIPLDLLSWS